MTNEERVIEFKSKLDKVFKTYFITELCINAVEVAVGVVAIMLALNSENQRTLMLTILAFLVVLLATSTVTIKLFFGSYSGLNKIINFRTRFDFVSKNLADSKKNLDAGKITADDCTIAQTIYDDEIRALADEIDNIKLKK